MSFTRLLQPKRRFARSWDVMLSLYDGRECPECWGIVIGRAGQAGHQRYHQDRMRFDSLTRDAIRALAEAAGLSVGELAAEDMPDGVFADEDQDDRLTRKARAVAAGGVDYDEEDDDGDY